MGQLLPSRQQSTNGTFHAFRPPGAAGGKGAAMESQRYVIEIDGMSAGLVIAGKNGYRFHAASAAFASLERRTFRSPGHAEDVCRSLTSTRKNARSPGVGHGHRLGDILAHRSVARDRDVSGISDEYVPEGGVPCGFPFTAS